MVKSLKRQIPIPLMTRKDAFLVMKSLKDRDVCVWDGQRPTITDLGHVSIKIALDLSPSKGDDIDAASDDDSWGPWSTINGNGHLGV